MVSIDTVYQRVLALANKEQRGYITPQEFNLFANQAQMEIFEQYFYDIKEYNRVPGNNQEYSDPLSVLYEKIGLFEMERGNAWMNVNMPVGAGGLVIPWNLIYKIGTVFVNRNKVATHTANIPDDENLALGAMQLSGSATGTKSKNIDYIFAAQVR